MFFKPFAKTLVMAACLMAVTGCDNKQAQQQQAEPTAEQAEVLKYNEYINAANMTSETYAKELAKYQKYIEPAFNGKTPLEDLFFSEPSAMPDIKASLDKARAMKPAMTELDGPAEAYSEALAKTEPLNRELYNYISAKNYISDKGAFGRKSQPAYLAHMQDLVAAQAAFLKGVDAKDRARIKAEFEGAEKETLAYYKIGMVYYLKESLDQANGMFEGKGLGDKKEAFGQSLDQFNRMVTGYDAKVRENNHAGCRSLRATANDYLSSGREIIERTENGRYAQESKGTGQFRIRMPASKSDTESLLQNYNNMINALNMGHC